MFKGLLNTTKSCERGSKKNGSECVRRLHVLNRHEYSVPGPHSLYHIDGHHKLIR